jgi:TonB family protein
VIPRTLVPVDIRAVNPAEQKVAPRRLSSTLDDRTIVPRDLPAKPLDAATAIPSHIPFDVIVGRSIIDKTWHVAPRSNGVARRIETVLDDRMVVPAVVEPPTPEELKKLEELPAITADLLDVVEPDVITTGEVNLLVGPREERDAKWNSVSRIVSLAVHIGVIVLALSSPDFFKHVPTQAELDRAKQQLGFIYLPSEANLTPRRPPARPSPNMRITPEVLNHVAPPLPSPSPGPPTNSAPTTPKPSISELPSSPVPQPKPATPQPDSSFEPIKPADNPPPPQPGKLNLSIPSSSPGRMLQDSVQDAIRHGGASNSLGTQSRIPGGGGGNGGGGSGTLGNTVSIISDTQGVDFNDYLARLLATVKRNWYAIIPESARLGDKGMVVIQFKIMKDGTVPFPDPSLMRTSGKEPLDRAAMSAIRASSPFEPLPSQFTLPSIELRFIFLYNLPLDYQ